MYVYPSIYILYEFEQCYLIRCFGCQTPKNSVRINRYLIRWGSKMLKSLNRCRCGWGRWVSQYHLSLPSLSGWRRKASLYKKSNNFFSKAYSSYSRTYFGERSLHTPHHTFSWPIRFQLFRHKMLKFKFLNLSFSFGHRARFNRNQNHSCVFFLFGNGITATTMRPADPPSPATSMENRRSWPNLQT